MMVFPYDESRLLAVLQIDHSRVAGLLAAHWGNAEFAAPTPYPSVVLAAQEHDNGWWDWEVKPTLNERGEPIDYITGGGLDRITHTAFDRNGIARVAAQDPYAALLVSLHLVGLNNQGWGLVPHMPDRRTMPGVPEFMGEQETLRARLTDELRASPTYAAYCTDDRLWTNYRLIEIADQMAQFICNRYPFNSTARRNGPPNALPHVPVAPGRDETILTLDVQDESRAVVRPYPFDVDPLVVSFPARILPRRSYPSQDDFLHDYYRAERLAVTYTLHAA
jgi:Protein of unknown function (DUF3891)